MLLLDTHVFVWLASDLDQLPKTARQAIQRHAGKLHFSAITSLEIGLLMKRGRLLLPLPGREFVRRAAEHHGIREIPVTSDITFRATVLPDIHNDPFDRILVATAQLGGLELVSKDRTLHRYPDLRVLWN